MFRDSEIISLINGLDKKINDLSNHSEEEILQKLADIESVCQELQAKVEDIEEKCLRDDEEFRFQIKQAMKEFWEIKMVKKQPKKTEKLVKGKKK